eukprot:TRINITY_DN9357_c0_g2_i1.p1 TRINITY_DN9357_c0_g2~~TRINITY_DN9357_c0_g2_i1.p1  ORF type:complete len:231 (+),score=48.81 TRINITY_DN9357_c0_g2_i1:58-693(+)
MAMQGAMLRRGAGRCATAAAAATAAARPRHSAAAGLRAAVDFSVVSPRRILAPSTALAPRLHVAHARWSRLFSAGQAGEDDLAAAVEEQRSVLFPKLRQLEEAQLSREQASTERAAAVPEAEWSPERVPYRTFERKGAEADSDSDSEDEDSDREASAAAAAGEAGGAASLAADGAGELSVGMGEDEVGFKYKGPEPTLYGDWAHKGRVSDF